MDGVCASGDYHICVALSDMLGCVLAVDKCPGVRSEQVVTAESVLSTSDSDQNHTGHELETIPLCQGQAYLTEDCVSKRLCRFEPEVAGVEATSKGYYLKQGRHRILTSTHTI